MYVNDIFLRKSYVTTKTLSQSIIFCGTIPQGPRLFLCVWVCRIRIQFGIKLVNNSLTIPQPISLLSIEPMKMKKKNKSSQQIVKIHLNISHNTLLSSSDCMNNEKKKTVFLFCNLNRHIQTISQFHNNERSKKTRINGIISLEENAIEPIYSQNIEIEKKRENEKGI